MKRADPFLRLLHAFFYEWLVQQRNASLHTRRSYRDKWRLFLRFVAQRQRRPVAQLRRAAYSYRSRPSDGRTHA